MSTVVRSLAAKVEVQTRDAERNLERFRAKLRATDIELRGAARYQQAGANPLFSSASVARQSAAVGAFRLQESFGASQLSFAQEAAAMNAMQRARRFGGSGIPITSGELGDLTFRGGGSIMGNVAGGGDLAALGAAGAGSGALSRFRTLGKLSALLRGAGPIAAGVVTLRQGLQTVADTMSNVEQVTSDNNSAWYNQQMIMMDAVSRFTFMKGPMDSLATSIYDLTEHGKKYRENLEAITTSLNAQADASAMLRKERDEGSAMMADSFMDSLARAEVETLAEQAEKTQRFADMQEIASSAAQRYERRVNELRMALMAGAISQDAFNESMRIANDLYDEQSGTMDELRYQRALMAAEFEDRQRAEQESLANAEIMRQKELRAARTRGVEVDLSRTFIGPGAGSGKQQVEDPKLIAAARETNRLLREVVRTRTTAVTAP